MKDLLFIRLDQGEDDEYWGRKRVKKRLLRTIIKGLNVSPGCDTIIIYDSRHKPIDDRRNIVARAIEATLDHNQIGPYKIQLQNIWPESMEERWLFDEHLERVQTMELKFDEWPGRTQLGDTILRCLISPASNLEELSLVANKYTWGFVFRQSPANYRKGSI